MRTKEKKYSLTCNCGHTMRVKKKHFGRMCRCTHCTYPIFITFENVSPSVDQADRESLRYFDEEHVPLLWERGDLLMEMYEVLDVLGEGAMGKVYKVHHRGWDTDLAVKTPKVPTDSRHDWLSIFQHECETWVSLPPHPHVVQCYYVRRLGSVPRVFVEYVEGCDLGALVSSRALYEGGPKVALLRILDMAIQYAWGLQHAHDQGLIHQDVKPGNAMVTNDGLIKVTDFGLARVFAGPNSEDGDEPRVAHGPQGGTARYRSPDRAEGQTISLKTDLWSWGLTLLEMFVGEPRWEIGRDARSLLDAYLDLWEPMTGTPTMPDVVSSLLYHCFEEDPAHRPDSMQAVADTLRAVYETEAGKAYGRSVPACAEASPALLNNRAVSLLDLGKRKEAEELWTRVLITDPGHIESNYNYYLHLWRAAQYTDAQLVEKLVELCRTRPDDWFAPYLCARVYMEQGNSRGAIKILERLGRSDLRRREVSYALAMAQNKRSDDRRVVWSTSADTVPVSAVALSFDGWRAVTANREGKIFMWEVPTATCTVVFDGHEGRVSDVALSNDERYIVSCGADQTIRLWEPSTQRCLHVLRGHTDRVNAAAMVSDGSAIVSAGRDGTLRVWDADTGQCVRVLEGHADSVLSLALSRDGKHALSGSRDKTLRLWDLDTGLCVRILEGNHKGVVATGLSADGMRALSASGRRIKLWDMENGSALIGYPAHQAPIQSVCLSEDGRFALSATRVGTVKIWNVRTGQCLRSFRGFGPVKLGRDGRFAICAGFNGAFQILAVHCDEPPLAAPHVICRDT